MEAPKIFESEYRFCQILWALEPVNSTELVKVCREKLGWKKSTTYTVIKRLSERGVVKLENACVTSLISQEQIQHSESRTFVDRIFGGSLPQFIAAFAGEKRLTRQEAEALRQMIDQYEEE